MKVPSKLKRVTKRLMEGPLDFIEAQEEVNDRSLHSTVAQLQREYGVQVNRRRIKRPGYRGIPTPCCEYRILPGEFEKARKALNFMR